MNKRKLIANLKQEFMLKRINAQEKAENFIQELCEKEEFNNLYSAYNYKKVEYIKSKYHEENLTLKYEVEDLKEKIKNYLATNNIDARKMSPQYSCKICNDTGVVAGKTCGCLLGELNRKISSLCSSINNFHSFEDCKPEIMNEQDIQSAKLLKTWCEKYPNTSKINVLILGGAGSGKTFMLECVANEMLKQQKVVCFKTAFELNELARLYHIGKSFDFSDCLTADILMIDDLGTEPILKNVTKEYLYNIINTRQMNNLPTFISTNLSPDNLLERYDERIYSRLANKNLSINIQLTSGDKRLK